MIRNVETGRFDELIRKGGPFAALAKAQFLVADAPTVAATTDDTPARGEVIVPPPNRIAEDAAE